MVRTQGDANPSFIRGTDYPITEEEYIGKVAYIIPLIGYITQILKPPINYIIIAIVVGIKYRKPRIRTTIIAIRVSDNFNQSTDFHNKTKALKEKHRIEYILY